MLEILINSSMEGKEGEKNRRKIERGRLRGVNYDFLY